MPGNILHYYIFCKKSRPLIFKTIINSAIVKSKSIKYQSFSPLVCKDIGIRKLKLVAMTQFP